VDCSYNERDRSCNEVDCSYDERDFSCNEVDRSGDEGDCSCNEGGYGCNVSGVNATFGYEIEREEL
jgi:hypothetical protein